MSIFNLFRRTSAAPNIEVPPQEFFEEAMQEVQHTPDAVHIERKADHLVFVGDELMTHPQHNRQFEGFKICLAFTENKFAFMRKNLGSHSTGIAFEKPLKDVPYVPIKGELYLIKPSEIFKLDKYRENTVQFRRIRVHLRIPYTRGKKVWVKDRARYEWALEQTPFMEEKVTAWMYVGIPDYWEPVINTGVKMRTYHRDGTRTFQRISREGLFAPVEAYAASNPRVGTHYFYNNQDYDQQQNYTESRPMFFVRK
jgi:hypothetical protein